MIVISPQTLSLPGDLLDSSVPLVVFDAWNATVSYAAGDIVTTDSGTRLWSASYASDAPKDPVSALPILDNEGRIPGSAIIPSGYAHAGLRWWKEVTSDPYAQPRHRMFSDNPAVITTADGEIAVTLLPSAAWDALALFNVRADTLTVSVGGATVATLELAWDAPLSPDFPCRMTAAALDLPDTEGAALGVTLSGTGEVWCGSLIVGARTVIGRTLYGTEVGIVDYSRKERDVFGNMLVIERGYTETVKYQFEIDTPTIAAARQFLASRRALATVFIGTVAHPESIVLGYYRDLLLPVERHSVSVADLEVESIVQDTPSRAAPALRAAFIRPDPDCVTSDLGGRADLCLKLDDDGETWRIDGRVYATVFGANPEDQVTWSVEWISGTSTVAHHVEPMETGCGQSLSVLKFPKPSEPVQPEPAVAAIKAVIVRPDESTVETNTLHLTLERCDEEESCQPCVPEIVSAGWYNDSSGEYDLTSVTGYVKQFAEAGAEDPVPPEEPGEPDQPEPIYCVFAVWFKSATTGAWVKVGSSNSASPADGDFFFAVEQVSPGYGVLSAGQYSSIVSQGFTGSVTKVAGSLNGTPGFYFSADDGNSSRFFEFAGTVTGRPGSITGRTVNFGLGA